MHPDKFGDSYDIVKRSTLEWLRSCGTWEAHPMFAQDFRQSCPYFTWQYSRFAERYSTFLDARLLTTEPLPSIGPGRRVKALWIPYMNQRRAYFKNARQWDKTDHLLLDPDTGLFQSGGVVGKPLDPRHYLMAEELLDIAKARPDKLVLVFDQSFSRNLDEKGRRRKTEEKLRWLDKHCVYGVAYLSHANFVLASGCKGVLDNVNRTLLQKSKLPKKRIVRI